MATGHNHLIELLPRPQRQHLLAQMESVPLVPATVLCEPGQPMRHAYFPTAGFISVVTPLPGHPGLEVGMVGQEGMLGAELALGVPRAPWRALVQGEGTAWRIGRAGLQQALGRGSALQAMGRGGALQAPGRGGALEAPGRGSALEALVHRYLCVQLAQLAASAACVRFHLIAPRLARWLLMGQDRAQADHFHVTHESLACMLGVRRVGITVAAGALQRSGLIAYHRGELSVLDRGGLQAVACGCYAADCRRYAEAMG